MQQRMAINQSISSGLTRLAKHSAQRPVIAAALLFTVVCLVLLLYRHYSLYSSYDQGIFNQIFWNSIHGRLFESSLSSGLSAEVLLHGGVPLVSYRHLGQHFNPIFLLWLPLYALFPFPETLSILQVLLIAAAGLVLYILARQQLSPRLSVLIAISFYGANTVLGPTLGNFHDYNPLPLFLFSLLLALEKGWWTLFWLMAILTLSIREDAGVPLLSVGLYLIVSRRRWRIGLALFTLTVAYILLLTNLIMPSFSSDFAERLIVERFGQYTSGKPASSAEAIGTILSSPGRILAELGSQFPRKLRYLLGHWLPLGFIPAISSDAWLLTAFPFLQLLLMQGDNSLSINIRYATLAVPGLFYGAILWWSKHPNAFQGKMPKFLSLCLALSLFFTVTSNPNLTLSFLIPDSIRPWVHISLGEQVRHAAQARAVMAQIPPPASIAATTYLIPPLSSRRAIVRFPDLSQFRDEAQQTQKVEYIIADLWRLQRYSPAFKSERSSLKASLDKIRQLLETQEYGIRAFQDQVVLLQQNLRTEPDTAAAWRSFIKQLRQNSPEVFSP
jgi:uncharacterized membrane protein